jgi:hypothetical protein
MKALLTNIVWASKATGQELQGPRRLVVELEPDSGSPLYVQLDEYLQARFLDSEDTALAVSSYTWEELP